MLFRVPFQVLATALISVTHHFCRDIRLAVGYALVVLDDLRPNIVERKVRFPRLHALALGAIALCIPKLLCDAPLAAELRHRPVDCNPSHDGDNSILLLAAVRIEQHAKCAPCHTRNFLSAKL